MVTSREDYILDENVRVVESEWQARQPEQSQKCFAFLIIIILKDRGAYKQRKK